MKIERTITVKATPQAVIEYLMSPQYITDLAAHPKNRAAGILDVNEAGRTLNDGELTDQIIRYKAATRLPKFLKKYEAKAPESVSWQENIHWERARCQATFNIVADAPAHWQERYSTAGKLTFTALADGTRVTHELEYKVQIFGLATIIERALSSEIESLFDTRNDIIRAHFESAS